MHILSQKSVLGSWWFWDGNIMHVGKDKCEGLKSFILYAI